MKLEQDCPSKVSLKENTGTSDPQALRDEYELGNVCVCLKFLEINDLCPDGYVGEGVPC